MSFQCYWSTQPSYDCNSRTFDFVSAIIRSRYCAMGMFWQFQQLQSNLSYIVSRTGWVAPGIHTVNFQSFDLINGVLKLDEAFEEVEKYLCFRSDTPKWKMLIQYSKYGYNNLDYGEVI